MNELDINSGLIGAIIPIALTAVFAAIQFLYKKNKKEEEKTLTKILKRLDSDKEKEVLFREEWGALKKELEIFSSSAVIVRQAAEEIVILKRNLETAFRKIDEVRTTSIELHQSIAIIQSLKDTIECVELSIDDNFKLVLGRLYVLKTSIESLGGIVLNADWVEPIKQSKEGE